MRVKRWLGPIRDVDVKSDELEGREQDLIEVFYGRSSTHWPRCIGTTRNL